MLFTAEGPPNTQAFSQVNKVQRARERWGAMTSSDLGESLWDGAQPNTSSLIASDAALKLQPAENSFGVLFVSSNDLQASLE